LSLRDLKKGATIAQIAFLIVLAVGVAEVIVASFATSVALLADGVQSIATSLIFLIVWVGINLSGRSPDGTFHFGYYRIEALGSLIAAFVLAVFGGLILFEAYGAWVALRVITNAETAILVASASAIMVLAVSAWVNRASRKLGSVALRVGGLSGALDVLASVAVFISVALSKYLGILHADSIAGILIAGAIFVGAYSIFKESSLVLVDACNCGDFVGAIGEMAKSVKGVKEVHSIRVRRLGPYMTGDMHVVVSSEMLVREADQIATDIEEKIKQTFEKVLDFKIRIESDEAHGRHSQELTIKKI
jgi:cation diffusion facilitator family transporter